MRFSMTAFLCFAMVGIAVSLFIPRNSDEQIHFEDDDDDDDDVAVKKFGKRGVLQEAPVPTTTAATDRDEDDDDEDIDDDLVDFILAQGQVGDDAENKDAENDMPVQQTPTPTGDSKEVQRNLQDDNADNLNAPTAVRAKPATVTQQQAGGPKSANSSSKTKAQRTRGKIEPAVDNKKIDPHKVLVRSAEALHENGPNEDVATLLDGINDALFTSNGTRKPLNEADTTSLVGVIYDASKVLQKRGGNDKIVADLRDAARSLAKDSGVTTSAPGETSVVAAIPRGRPRVTKNVTHGASSVVINTNSVVPAVRARQAKLTLLSDESNQRGTQIRSLPKAEGSMTAHQTADNPRLNLNQDQPQDHIPEILGNVHLVGIVVAYSSVNEDDQLATGPTGHSRFFIPIGEQQSQEQLLTKQFMGQQQQDIGFQGDQEGQFNGGGQFQPGQDFQQGPEGRGEQGFFSRGQPNYQQYDRQPYGNNGYGNGGGGYGGGGGGYERPY